MLKLIRQAELATCRKEAVVLIHKAAKLKTKSLEYEMIQTEDIRLIGKLENQNLEIN